MATADFRRQLEGFGLTTASILYHMPDHPGILQNFVWQQHDLHPHFPSSKNSSTSGRVSWTACFIP